MSNYVHRISDLLNLMVKLVSFFRAESMINFARVMICEEPVGTRGEGSRFETKITITF